MVSFDFDKQGLTFGQSSLTLRRKDLVMEKGVGTDLCDVDKTVTSIREKFNDHSIHGMISCGLDLVNKRDHKTLGSTRYITEDVIAIVNIIKAALLESSCVQERFVTEIGNLDEPIAFHVIESLDGRHDPRRRNLRQRNSFFWRGLTGNPFTMEIFS